MSRRIATGVCAFGMCCAVSTTSLSAQRETGPFAGLFGGGRDGEAKQTLRLQWSGYGGYDDTLLDQARQLAADPRFQKSGEYAGVSLGLGYQRTAGPNRFTIDGASAVRAYGATRAISAPMYTASTGFDFAVTPHTSIRGSFSGSRSSFYQFAPFLVTDAVADVPTYGFAAVRQRSLTTSASVGLSQRLTSRMTLSTDASWRRAQFQNADAGRLESRSASFRLQGGLSRDLGFHAGYGYGEGRFGDVPTDERPAIIHDLDVGLDFNHALSLSRRTKIRFGTGSSIIRPQDRIARYRLTGDASLTQGIGRTWNATASYLRGSQFVQGFSDVVFSDSVTAGFGGLLSPRMQLVASAGYSSGTVGVAADTPRFGSYSGSGKLSFAFSRVLGAYVEYVYYRYNVPPGSIVGFDQLPPRLDRQALTFGVSGAVPLMNETRPRRDSR